MAIVDLVMPKMGESIMEATILKWHKGIGDFIKQDEIVLDIATDKVDSEIPSTVEGVLKEIFFKVNDVVPVGTVLAKIEIGVTADHKPAAPVVEPASVVAEKEVMPIPVVHVAPAPVQEATADFVPFTPTPSVNKLPNNNRFFSPLVLNIANSEGLNLSELENIAGTGAENRVTKRDILQYIADKKAGKIQHVAAPIYQTYVVPTPAPVYVEPAKTVLEEVAAHPVAEAVAVAAATVATAVVVEHVAKKETPAAEHIDTSAFIKQEVSLPAPVEEVAEAIQPAAVVEEVHHAYKTDDTPVAIAPVEEVIVSPLVEEAAAVEIASSVAPVEPAPVEVSTVVETVHTSPVNVHIQPTVVPSTPATIVENAIEEKAKEAYRVSYEEHIKETIQPSNTNNTIHTQPTQNIMSEAKPSVEIIEMDRMRKLIAKHMVDSKHTSPHVTSFAEADVTNMVQWRERVKGDFEKREGIKLTFTPMFIECILKVLKRYPLINSSVDGDKIIIKNFFNIGFATALPTGNLIVPVIKDAQNHNLISLTRSVSTLAENARNHKLKPDDTTGGTFTFSNLGNFGSLMGTPIINQPQSAIMAVGAIKKRPVVIETDKGDFIGIRQMMYLSLSYDHRIIDGSVGASFLTEVAKEFESWNLDRELKYVVKEWYVE